MSKVKIIVAKEKLDCTHLLGKFLDESHYDTLIESDTDAYMPPLCDLATKLDCADEKKECADCPAGVDQDRVAFKFRKNWFSKKLQNQAYEGLREAATQSQNRGLAAGPKGDFLQAEKRNGREWVKDYELEVLEYFLRPINALVDDNSLEKIRKKYRDSNVNEGSRGQVWLRSEVTKRYPDYYGWFDKWADGLHNLPREEQIKEAEDIVENYISTTNYAQSVYSGVAGYYDRYPRLPYGRPTAYTKDNYDKFKLSFPFLESLNKGYKELCRPKWDAQKAACDKIDPKFLIPNTVFTTITVNKSFRTAAHYDAGDLNSGISNLLTVSNNGNYKGGYLVFPEYRIAVNVRPGDLLLVNNHEIMHGNTPIELLDDTAERISLVCYFREAMLELGSWDYEMCRFDYVEQRRKNKNHPLNRKLWNGISAGMWEEKEWYDYLEARLGKETLAKYHPETVVNSIEGFFN